MLKMTREVRTTNVYVSACFNFLNIYDRFFDGYHQTRKFGLEDVVVNLSTEYLSVYSERRKDPLHAVVHVIDERFEPTESYYVMRKLLSSELHGKECESLLQGVRERSAR